MSGVIDDCYMFIITSNNRTPQSLKLKQLKNKSPGKTIFTHKLQATKSCYNGYKELTCIECVIFLIHTIRNTVSL